ncbi:MAG: glycoside hydrolase [Planctomycetota bacterium]
MLRDRKSVLRAARATAAAVCVVMLALSAFAGDLRPPAAASPVTLQLGGADAWRPHGGGLEERGTELMLRPQGGHFYVERSLPALKGPAILEMEIKATAGGEEPYVSWATEGTRDWRSFVRIPIVYSGEWQRYALPITAGDALVGLRLSFGGPGGEIAIRNATLRQVDLRGALPAVADQRVQRAALRLTYDSASRSYRLADSRTGRVWRSEPLPGLLAVEGAEAAGETIALYLLNRFNGRRATLHASLGDDATVTFRVKASAEGDAIAGLQQLPPRFATDFRDGALVFCDRSCGVLLDQRDTTYSHWPLRVYGSTHCLDMPWIGVFDQGRGDGVMTVIDTPADAEVSLIADAEGRHWPQPRWMASMDRFGYERSCTMHFFDGGGYVALAKRYREVARKAGLLKTLEEKARDKPELARIKGAPLLWAGRDAKEQMEVAAALGVRRGVVNNCTKRHKVEWLTERGYLVGRYDSYTDIFEGPVDFQRDDIDKTAVRLRPGLGPMNGWQFEDGRQMAWRSSAFWMQAARSYVPRHLAKSGHNSRFVDVAVAATPTEDWAPEHTFDRRQDLAQRREVFTYLNELGLPLGTEHGNDWAADLVDWHEGSLSGPFWWSSWPAGHLKAPTREQLSDNYLKFGMGYAHRVPLWQLVYHDCLVSSWYWGENAGMLYHAAPELADRKDLFTLLYGGTPLLWIDSPDRGYGWPKNQRRWLKTHHDTCKFFEEVAFAELTDHQFLSDDRALQRSSFSGGAEVTVNFSDEPRQLSDKSGVELAPLGYLATAPGFVQERLTVDGQTVSRAKTDGWIMLESKQPISRDGIEASGRVTLFEVSPSEWRVVGEPGREYAFDLAEITGWPESRSVEVRSVDEAGQMGPSISATTVSQRLELAATDQVWCFAIIAGEASDAGAATSMTTREEPN